MDSEKSGSRPASGPACPAPWALRLARRLDPSVPRGRGVKSAFLAVAVLFLLGGVLFSLGRHPEILTGLDWRPALLVLLVAIPVTVVLNGYEFVLSGRLIGREIAFLRALEISVIGTAANLLPLPGATLVRVAGLRAAGAGYGDGTAATLLTAALWVGVAFLFSGLWLLAGQSGWIGPAFVAVGAVTWIGCAVLGHRLSGRPGLVAGLTVIKLLLVVTDVSRIYLCLWALGAEVAFAQAAAFAVAGVAGSAVSVVPAGLGVREGVSAALAPLVGLSAALGFLAAALNRLLELAAVAPLALAMLVLTRRQARSGEAPA